VKKQNARTMELGARVFLFANLNSVPLIFKNHNSNAFFSW